MRRIKAYKILVVVLLLSLNLFFVSCSNIWNFDKNQNHYITEISNE